MKKLILSLVLIITSITAWAKPLVSYETKKAIVTLEDTKTNTELLIQATTRHIRRA